MRASRVLQLAMLLVGPCLACSAAPPRGAAGTGGPVQGAEDNGARLGRQRDQASAQLVGGGQAPYGLRTQGLQAGRTHGQVRKDLRVVNVQGVVQDLKLGLGDLVREQAALEGRMSHVLRRARQPGSGAGTEVNVSLLKVMMDKQARRLTNLAAEITARERRINRHQQVEHLEKQVSGTGGRQPHSVLDAGVVV